MPVEPLSQRLNEGYKCKWQNYPCQDDVRDQDREVDDPDRALAGERDRADVEVVGEVRDQKQCRRRERTYHARSVGPDSSLANHQVPGDQEQARDTVEYRV